MSDNSGTVMVGDATFFGTPEACAAFVKAMRRSATEGRGSRLDAFNQQLSELVRAKFGGETVPSGAEEASGCAGLAGVDA